MNNMEIVDTICAYVTSKRNAYFKRSTNKHSTHIYRLKSDNSNDMCWRVFMRSSCVIVFDIAWPEWRLNKLIVDLNSQNSIKEIEEYFSKYLELKEVQILD